VKIFHRPIQVDAGVMVSSVWAVPRGYRADAAPVLVLAHGAGNDMHNPLLSYVHERTAAAGLPCVKFNFPYKEQGRKAPDRPALLQACWRAVADAVRADPELAPSRLFLGGKSMGGRMASLVAASGYPCAGLVFLGYPLHPAGKPHSLRTDHWPRIRCPMLFIQGTRDRLCDLQRLRAALDGLEARATLHVVEGADHSFKVLKRLGRSDSEVWAEIVSVTTSWIRGRA
jgi:predicted alpha/beta-hydrolase family hydrolase